MATTDATTSTPSRPCIFINHLGESSSKLPSDNNPPLIIPPFPPTIDPRDLITLLPDGRVPTRAPNAFIIYRKAFIDAVRDSGNYLPMTVVSLMASKSWEQASDVVKEEYKRLAKKAFDYRNEICPKSQRRRKREKWNVVSFNQFSSGRNNRSGKSTKSRSLPTSRISPTNIEPRPSTIPEISDNVNSQQTSFDFYNFTAGSTENLHNNLPSLAPSIPSSGSNSIVSSPDLNEIDTNVFLQTDDPHTITLEEEQPLVVWPEFKYSSNAAYNRSESVLMNYNQPYQPYDDHMNGDLFYSILSNESRDESIPFSFDLLDNAAAFSNNFTNFEPFDVINTWNDNLCTTSYIEALSSPIYYF
ncbi:6083_t:CDS:1 [Acaulospora colombiana]|uniref:6083_t:CDS:1 n=1 Tax=Acaulospora colombiana TaxID=27376 RepID=A0ACA9KCM9_9GLOM|nr:6083_t:CDS:1 [Acaulospora colombiana]